MAYCEFTHSAWPRRTQAEMRQVRTESESIKPIHMLSHHTPRFPAKTPSAMNVGIPSTLINSTRRV